MSHVVRVPRTSNICPGTYLQKHRHPIWRHQILFWVPPTCTNRIWKHDSIANSLRIFVGMTSRPISDYAVAGGHVSGDDAVSTSTFTQSIRSWSSRSTLLAVRCAWPLLGFCNGTRVVDCEDVWWRAGAMLGWLWTRLQMEYLGIHGSCRLWSFNMVWTSSIWAYADWRFVGMVYRCGGCT